MSENKLKMIDSEHVLGVKDMLAIKKRIKSLGKKCIEYEVRECKNNQVVYLYNIGDKVIAETLKSYYDAENNKIGYHYYPVGVLEFEINKYKNNIHISYLKVEDEYQDQGIGSELLNYIKGFANKKVIKNITLNRLQVFTNGFTTFTYRNKFQPLALQVLQDTTSYYDRNKVFYNKNGFTDDKKTKPQTTYLVPMKLNNPKKVVKGKLYKSDFVKPKRFTQEEKLYREINKNNRIKDKYIKEICKIGKVK